LGDIRPNECEVAVTSKRPCTRSLLNQQNQICLSNKENNKVTVTKNSSKRNYGNRVNDPWVFVMVEQKLSDFEIT
jgi:hypothetical protein